MLLNKKHFTAPALVVCGVFSKKQAASLIAGGCAHVHSTPRHEQDPHYQATQAALASNQQAQYAWETLPEFEELKLSSSVDRLALIDETVSRLGLTTKRSVREKVESTLEELLSNALYHSYRSTTGGEKYQRRDSVTLTNSEIITLGFGKAKDGLLLQVTDQAGSLQFEQVASSLGRCYETSAQVEQKASGAGLGTYMIFDASTHIKFESVPGKYTKVSCWIADSKSFEANHFSFNFFEVRQDK